MEKSKELAILVYSCWKNSDMWEIFMKLFKKYWSDCEYKLILLTDKCEKDKKDYAFDDIVVLDSNWHDMIMAGISQADTEYVMLFMDDYLLCDYVDNQDMAKYIAYARKYDVANIRFAESPTIPARKYKEDHDFNFYVPGTAYSFSTQPGIWSVRFLKEHVRPDWSAWDFERKGSLVVKDEKHPLLATRHYTFPYEEGVRKGKWMDSGVRLCKRNQIHIDFKKRKEMTNFELSWIYFKGGILEFNPTFIVKVQNFFQKKR